MVLITYLNFEEDKKRGYDSWTLFAEEVNKVKRIFETFGHKILIVDMLPDFTCRLHIYKGVDENFVKSLQDVTMVNCRIELE